MLTRITMDIRNSDQDYQITEIIWKDLELFNFKDFKANIVIEKFYLFDMFVPKYILSYFKLLSKFVIVFHSQSI